MNGHTSPGSTTLKIIVTVCIAGLFYFGGSIYFRFQENAKREKQMKATEEFRRTARDVTEQAQQELKQDGGLSSETLVKTREKMLQQFSKLATVDKNAQLTMEVMSEIQEKAAAHHALLRRVNEERPFEMITVKAKTDLAARRKLGEELLRTNSEILAFVDSIESRVREKVLKAGFPNAEATVAEFMTGWNKSASATRRAWQAGVTGAKSLIAVADLLDAHWGEWQVGNDLLNFNDDKIAKKYNGLLDMAQKAQEDTVAAQRELIEIQRAAR